MGTGRIVLVVSILSGLLLASGMNAQSLICVIVLLILTASALGSIAHKPALKKLLLVMIGFALGPSIVCLLFRTLFQHFELAFGARTSSVVLLLCLLGLMTISFIYARARIARWINDPKASLHTNERQPLPPVPQEDEEDQ